VLATERHPLALLSILSCGHGLGCNEGAGSDDLPQLRYMEKSQYEVQN
jgi:hypothetical protein